MLIFPKIILKRSHLATSGISLSFLGLIVFFMLEHGHAHLGIKTEKIIKSCNSSLFIFYPFIPKLYKF